jgi:glycosyltransferase involved in cell wall biosynthesis
VGAHTPFASVIICTRNRSTFLREILRIDYPKRAWELLIVDNGSTDDTFQVAQKFAADHPSLVRVVQEPQTGLSVARNRGIREAKGEIIAFIDDDAFPDPKWLESTVEAFADSGVMCAGGPVDPMFQGDTRLPDWFIGRFLPYLTVFDRGPVPVELRFNEYPRGANIAYRRDVFERYGTFSPHLGRKGSRLLSCEETEHCLRIERAGGRTLYVPRARVRHLTVAERITPAWMVRRFRAQGQSEAIVNWIHAGWEGVCVGWRTLRRTAREARQRRAIDGAVLTACQRASYRGYVMTIPSAVLRVPRYVPGPSAGELSDWLPFA